MSRLQGCHGVLTMAGEATCSHTETNDIMEHPIIPAIICVREGDVMTRQEIIDFCLTLPAAYEDYPFDNITESGKWTVMRHRANKKSFASIYERNGKLCVNLKCEPVEADLLRQLFQDVMPGYHMNKVHWNTILIGGDVSAEELMRQIQVSYELIRPKRKPRPQQ